MRENDTDAKTASDYDAWFRCAAQERVDSANAGHLIPAEEIEAEARAWREETRRRMAESS